MNGIIRHITDSKAILTPLSGVSDLAFRLIARKYGCPFAFTEMIDTNAIFYSNARTFRMLDTEPGEGPVGVQLVGGDAERLLDAAEICVKKGFQLIDINAACPAKKVTRKDKGGILMKDPKRLGSIVRTLAKNLSVPVTVKLRAGWAPEDASAVECAKAAEGEGASAVFIHPRYVSQKYRGSPHYDVARRIKEAVRVPVIASGDIFGPESAKEMFDRTGCDAVAVARGSFGRPWIFREIRAFLEGRPVPPPPSFEEVKEIFREHARLSLKFKGERLAKMKMYKHLNWYLKEHPRRKEIMRRYTELKNMEDVITFVEGLEWK